jgi:hypothetical protein
MPNDLFDFVNPHPAGFNEIYDTKILPAAYANDALWYDRRVVRDMRASAAYYSRRFRPFLPRGRNREPTELSVMELAIAGVLDQYSIDEEHKQ